MLIIKCYKFDWNDYDVFFNKARPIRKKTVQT